MEGGRFDASAYMLFEASGDSDDGAAEAESAAAAHEDDAQSCSYGSVSDSAAVHGVDDAGGDADFDDSDGEEEYGDRNSDEEEGVVDQCCGVPAKDSVVPGAAKEKLNHEQKACEDSNLKLMNERETDRLFWEACLAS